MVAVKLEQFGGMLPAVDTRLLPPNQAEASQNAWLYTGNIEPFRNQTLIYTNLVPTTRKAYRIPKLWYEDRKSVV
jgi:hypothetical protein